jgi:iron complex outermembrane receptor protein
MHTGDYASAAGKVVNSHAWMSSAQVGAGHYNERFGSFYNYNHQEGRYGVPAAPGETGNVDLVWRRDNLRFQGEWHAPAAWLDDVQLSANFSDWNHREMEGGQTGTEFSNRQVITRVVAVQKPRGRWSGSFGGSTLWRDYQARGAEALTPPVRGQSYAAFVLEELSFRRARLQFGSRLEHSSYSPDGLAARSFTGASSSAGASLPLWKNGSVVLNYMHSWRAPALEELYNHGPHPGNGVYEVGNTGLQREAGDGVEASLRHQGNRVRAEFNLFRYQMHDFVYLQPTGAMLEGLIAARYQQNDARFLGAESKLNVRLRENLWLITGGDLVQAKLTANGQSLPRIPPSRLRLGLDWHWKSLNVRPEWTLANRQWMTAPNETPTAGYSTGSLSASYSVVRKHAMHTFQFTAFNLNNRLYENHLSFIKAYAPEIGRGVRIGYTLQLF